MITKAELDSLQQEYHAILSLTGGDTTAAALLYLGRKMSSAGLRVESGLQSLERTVQSMDQPQPHAVGRY